MKASTIGLNGLNKNKFGSYMRTTYLYNINHEKKNIMKKLFFTIIIGMSFLYTKAQVNNIDSLILNGHITDCRMSEDPNKPCYDDAVIPSYARCFYVTFVAVCCDGIKRSGHLGCNVASGVPSEAGLKNLIGMQLHAIPNNVVIKWRENISTADYRDIFAGQYGKVIVHK
jgi:hypothetical protein